MYCPQADGITELLMAPAKLKDKIPGISGTRNLSDNLSDMKAQVAANNKGISLVKELIEEYSLQVVQAYMRFIQVWSLILYLLKWLQIALATEKIRIDEDSWTCISACCMWACKFSWIVLISFFPVQENAEESVREMLRAFAKEQKLGDTGSVTSVDHMDDGTPIALTITINSEAGAAEFDFEGTGPQVFNSCNAPPAVTYSAIIYSLRCLVKSEIPLNQVCHAHTNFAALTCQMQAFLESRWVVETCSSIVTGMVECFVLHRQTEVIVQQQRAPLCSACLFVLLVMPSSCIDPYTSI